MTEIDHVLRVMLPLLRDQYTPMGLEYVKVVPLSSCVPHIKICFCLVSSMLVFSTTLAYMVLFPDVFNSSKCR